MAVNRTALSAFCESQLPATLDFLRRMVAINSFTENAAGVNALGELTATEFAGLGFTAEFFQGPRASYGRHLVLQRKGAKSAKDAEVIEGTESPLRSSASFAPLRSTAPTIALISHLDTVFPAEEEVRNNFVWRPEGRRIYGPGTNDIKGGTAMIYLTLGALREHAREMFEGTNWFVLLNCCEETISEDFGRLCREQLPANTRACLIFEADGSDEEFSIVAARKGRATFTIEVEGRAAHAGGDHARGANAIVQLASLIEAVAKLTDYEAGATVNVGNITGGTVTNRVPHFARAELEMRAFTTEAYERTKQAILALAGEGTVRSADGHACAVSIRVDDETAPWPPNPETDALISLWQKTGCEHGLRVGREQRGGLSDGNVLWEHFPTVDGLGPRGDYSHCSEQSVDGSKQQEWVDVESFVPKAVLNALAIARLCAPDESS